MAIKINNTTVIDNNKRGEFGIINFGTYTQDQLNDLVVVGTSTNDFVFNSTKMKLVFWDGEKWGASDMSAFGGEEITVSGYKYHVFTSSGSFQVSVAGDDGKAEVEILLVGGGGSGSSSGGGGGAGGVVHDSTLTVRAGETYAVSIGQGGTWNGNPACSGGSSGQPGAPTTFKNSGPVNLLALGGGGGAYCPGTPNAPGTPGPNSGSGGSGGGAGRVNGTGGIGRQALIAQTGGSQNLVGYGSNGWNRTVPGGPGGGAGGADGTSGGPGQAFFGFSADFLSPIMPAEWVTAVKAEGYYGGGGGGGGYPSPSPNLGGVGGGGPSAGYDGTSAGSPGIDNTGGGGGAGSYPARPGGRGGNGIVIIRYEV